MSKQTAIEWLIDELDYETISKFNFKLEQAKEMEKKQIMNAWAIGIFSEGHMTAEDYYNETFKNK